MTDILKKEDCEEILRNFLNSADFHLVSHKIVNFHNPFQGLVGQHFTLQIQYNFNHTTKCQDFFLKTLSTNPFMVSLSQELMVYEKEVFFYDLLRKFEKFEINTCFAPKCFFFKPYVLVLEDLSEEYKGTPKKTCLDYNQCVSCLTTLAQFHASTIIYERKKEILLNDENVKVLEDKLDSQDAKLCQKWFQNAVRSLLDLIDFLPETDVTNEEFKNKLAELLEVNEKLEGLINSILHGDLWTSNFMYSKNDVKLLDFQIISYGPIEKDVLEFFMLNTTRQFRSEHYEELIHHYYKKLEQVLMGSNLTTVLPPFSKFLDSCNNFLIPGKIRAAVDHSYTFMEDSVYEEVMKSAESYKKFLFEDRDKYVTDAFKKSVVFKKMLEEDLVELRDLLFSS